MHFAIKTNVVFWKHLEQLKWAKWATNTVSEIHPIPIPSTYSSLFLWNHPHMYRAELGFMQTSSINCERFCLSHSLISCIWFPSRKFNTLLHDNECSFCLSQATHSQSPVSLIRVFSANLRGSNECLAWMSFLCSYSMGMLKVSCMINHCPVTLARKCSWNCSSTARVDIYFGKAV